MLPFFVLSRDNIDMTLDLFSSNDNVNAPTIINLGDAELYYYSNFLSLHHADQSMNTLLNEVVWRQEFIAMYGVSRPIPRLSAWYGDRGVAYEYSGIKGDSNTWTPELLRLKCDIEKRTAEVFNGVLVNLYRDERDSVSWHSDDEVSLGLAPVVASLSFGEIRRFQLKHKQALYDSVNIDLTHGSLLVMRAGVQNNWLHQVPKSTRKLGKRINLTFRKVIQ